MPHLRRRRFLLEKEMCESCSGTVCYEGCPFYEKETASTVCECCDEVIAPGDGRYVRGERSLCEDCAEHLSADDLLDLGGLRGIGELLTLLGYRRS